jgi:CheY-like chemotaxis protein
MIKIIFFEDQPYASENQLFRTLLRDHLKKMCTLQFREVKSVSKFEELMRKDKYDIVILDIMSAAAKPFNWTGTNDEVPKSLTGVELLWRCRLDEYDRHYKDTPVYMRTARGEPYVRSLCQRAGATGFFKAGVDDLLLIKEIELLCKDIIKRK